jgi:alpha-tubulin suppressor-like RCC1 family protein
MKHWLSIFILLSFIACTPPSPTINNILISASRVTLREFESSILTATINGTGDYNPDLTWAIESGGVGSLSSNSGSTITYQTSSTSFGQVVRITATSVQDSKHKKTIFVSINPIKASIATGGTHSIAIKSDGTLLSWGFNYSGQLGNGTTNVHQFIPTPVNNAKDIVAIAAGGNHSLALKSNGTLLSWGGDTFGQLGDGGNNTDQPEPVAIIGAENIIAIATGGRHSLALKSDGTLLAWGGDDVGQLGNIATNATESSPIQVSGASDIIAIAAGSSHSLALKSNGTVLSWGSDSDGQLGDSDSIENQSTPVPVLNASNIIAISAGSNHSLALKSDGTILSWGSDFYGQLGDNDSVNKPKPVAVTEARNIVAISAGSSHSLALKADGTILSWGYDLHGQLGDGGINSVQLKPVSVGNANNIVGISGGGFHSLALKSDGTLISWGSDVYGELGNGGANEDQTTPVSVLLGLATIRHP